MHGMQQCTSNAQGPLIILNLDCRHCCPSPQGVLVPLCMLDIFLQINVNACGLQTHDYEAFVGVLYDPKIDLQKNWPLRWTTSYFLRGCMWIATKPAVRGLFALLGDFS